MSAPLSNPVKSPVRVSVSTRIAFGLRVAKAEVALPVFVWDGARWISSHSLAEHLGR